MEKYCQSCGMPMSADPKGAGTNADGTTSEMYCSYCYEGGKFTAECTAKEMQTFCKNKMKEMGLPSWKAWLLTRGIPSLKRWKRR